MDQGASMQANGTIIATTDPKRSFQSDITSNNQSPIAGAYMRVAARIRVAAPHASPAPTTHHKDWRRYPSINIHAIKTTNIAAGTSVITAPEGTIQVGKIIATAQPIKLNLAEPVTEWTRR